jgi:hypothetical protein
VKIYVRRVRCREFPSKVIRYTVLSGL